MAKDRVKGPRSTHARTLPPDTKSLEDMFRSVHRQLLERGAHLRREPHDFNARRGFQTLFEQRAAAWQRLDELEQNRAENLRLEFNLIFSQTEVA